MSLENNSIKESDVLNVDILGLPQKSSPTHQTLINPGQGAVGVGLTSKAEQVNVQHTHSSQRSSIKKSKKNCRQRRKAFSSAKQIKRNLKGKLLSEINMCKDNDKDGDLSVASKNGDSEEGEEDSMPSNSVTTAHGEPSLGSTILDEILSEKKKALLESPEMVEFLQSHVNIKPS